MKEKRLIPVKTKLLSLPDIKGPDGLPLLPIPGVGYVGDPNRSRNARVQAYVSLYVRLKKHISPIKDIQLLELGVPGTHPEEEDLYTLQTPLIDEADIL